MYKEQADVPLTKGSNRYTRSKVFLKRKKYRPGLCKTCLWILLGITAVILACMVIVAFVLSIVDYTKIGSGKKIINNINIINNSSSSSSNNSSQNLPPGRNEIFVPSWEVGKGEENGFFVNQETFVSSPVVKIPNGFMRGVLEEVDGQGIAVFFGIPYALPPVGNLRWQPPVYNNQQWSGILNATTLPPLCPQVLIPITPHPFHRAQSEDCLTLDVWVPLRRSPDEVMPVMYWIHGGGFMTGAPFSFGNGNYSSLAVRERLIVVSVNYRLGALGFLSADALADGDSTNDRGTYGMLDQRMGMIWVQNNIHYFGGSPNRVTIHGQSVGGFSVCQHLVSPLNLVGTLSENEIVNQDLSLSSVQVNSTMLVPRLFERGSIASGLCDVNPSRNNPTDQAFMASIGCSTRACLLIKSVDEILASEPDGAVPISFQPTTGSRFLPLNPIELLGNWAVTGKRWVYAFSDNNNVQPANEAIEYQISYQQFNDDDDDQDDDHTVTVIQGNVNQEGAGLMWSYFPESLSDPQVPTQAEFEGVYIGGLLQGNAAFYEQYLASIYTPNGSNPQATYLPTTPGDAFVVALNDFAVCLGMSNIWYFGNITKGNGAFGYWFDSDPFTAFYNYTLANNGFNAAAFHTTEEFFLADLPFYPFVTELTPAQHKLARDVQGYWGSFVRHGIPKPLPNSGQPSWNPYSPCNQTMIQFQATGANSPNPQGSGSVSITNIPYESITDHGKYYYDTRCAYLEYQRSVLYNVPSIYSAGYLPANCNGNLAPSFS